MASTNTQTCFVICPIGEEGSETRKRSDQILTHLIEPASKDCGFVALRADRISEPGVITSQVIQHIVDDPLVIADLTGRNANVFYELAVRHAISKPIVQIIQKGDTIPFDVAVTRTIHVDHHDLDSVSIAREELIKHIRSAIKDPKQVDSPISIALTIKLLRENSTPERESISALLDISESMRFSFRELQEMLNKFYSAYDSARMGEKELLRSIHDSVAMAQAEQSKRLSDSIEMIYDELRRIQDLFGAR